MATLNFTEQAEPWTLKLFPRADRHDEDAALFVDLTIEVRDPGTGDVLFSSGQDPRRASRRASLYAIVPNIGPGPASVQLMGVDRPSRGTSIRRDDRAEVRFVHVSTDSPALDVIRAAAAARRSRRTSRSAIDPTTCRSPNGETDLIATPTGGSGDVSCSSRSSRRRAPAATALYAVGPLASVDG